MTLLHFSELQILTYKGTQICIGRNAVVDFLGILQSLDSCKEHWPYQKYWSIQFSHQIEQDCISLKADQNKPYSRKKKKLEQIFFSNLKETLTSFSRMDMYPERKIREKYYTQQDNKLTDFHSYELSQKPIMCTLLEQHPMAY